MPGDRLQKSKFPYAPGSSGYAYKTLADVAAYTLTDTQSAAALAKKVNIYTSLAGVNCTQMGTSGSGEWIDIIIGIDWLTADIQTAIFTALVNNQKIPYTDTGVQMVVNPLNGALRDGVNNGLLSDAPNAITITYPVVSSVSAATKGTRLLPNVNFVAILAGAISSSIPKTNANCPGMLDLILFQKEMFDWPKATLTKVFLAIFKLHPASFKDFLKENISFEGTFAKSTKTIDF